MRKFWSNTCERTQGNEKDACSTSQGEDSSYPKAIEVMLRETARKSYPDPENIDNPMIALQDYEVRHSGRVLELQNRDLWTRLTDLSWHIPIIVTVRELPFKNYRGRSLAKLEARDEAKKHKTQKHRRRSRTQPDGSSHLGLGQLHPHLLLGKNGAQTMRVSVLIGRQLIGTVQIKRARTLHSSHISLGSEVFFIYLHNKGIYGDENNVCLRLRTTFRHFCHLL